MALSRTRPDVLHRRRCCRAWNAARMFDIVNVARHARRRAAGTRALFPSRLQPQLLLIVLRRARSPGSCRYSSRAGRAVQLPLTPLDPLFCASVAGRRPPAPSARRCRPSFIGWPR